MRFRCHRYYVESGIRKYKLASMAGISDTLLKNIDKPDFQASLKTLQRLDAVIPEDWEPAQGENTVVHQPQFMMQPATGDPVLGFKIWQSDLSHSRKIYLRQESLHRLEPDQVERCARYIESIREPDGRLLERSFKLQVLRTIAPQCAIHVFNVGDEDSRDFFIEQWDNGTGFWNGRDMSGMRFSELEDPALSSCQLEDYLVCRETGWPHLAVLHRKYADKEPRSGFVRLMYPFEGADGLPKILSITRPQPKGPAVELLERKLPANDLKPGGGAAGFEIHRAK